MAHKVPDEKIYGSSALPLRMFRYDPITGESVNLGNPLKSRSQIYSMTNYDDKMYIAVLLSKPLYPYMIRIYLGISGLRPITIPDISE